MSWAWEIDNSLCQYHMVQFQCMFLQCTGDLASFIHVYDIRGLHRLAEEGIGGLGITALHRHPGKEVMSHKSEPVLPYDTGSLDP